MIGPKVRELREKNDVLLRQLAARIDVDPAILSKMERGERFFKKEDIIEIAKIFGTNQNELISLWLADKVYRILANEKQALDALKIAKTALESNTDKA